VLQGAQAGEAWCATFTDTGASERWIQFTSDAVNMAYPHPDAPVERLAVLVPSGALQLAT
jgi:hypothetical protein